MKEKQLIIPLQGLSDIKAVGATYYYGSTHRGTILYLHGGGFLFGQREDLPQPYLERLIGQGYHLLALDYPLAPQVSLPLIMTAIAQSVEWFETMGYRELGLSDRDYFLLGRSAGAYAALLLASHQSSDHLRGVASFYGYTTLQDAAFSYPSRDYLKLPAVPETVAQQLQQSPVVTQDATQQRYLLYVYARQTGQWLSLLGISTEDLTHSLTVQSDQITCPLFITHARRDPDVPFRQSSRLAQAVVDATFIPVESDRHDFDRVDIEGLGMSIYEQFIQWLDQYSR